jgi:hypothetical protein
MAITMTYKDTFDSGYKGKYLTGPKADIDYTLTIEADPKTPEGKELQTEVEKSWKVMMQTFRKAQEKKFKDAIAATEKIVEKKNKTEKELKEFVDTANIMLKKGIEAMQSQVDGVAQEVYKKAVDKVAKKFKKAIRAEKVKAAIKIAIFVGIILTAAAVSIAATVLTGGAAAPLIIAAIITGLGALKKSYDTISTNWPTQQKALKALADSTAALADAIKFEEKKAEDLIVKGKIKKTDKLKTLVTNLGGKKKDVDKNIKLLQNFIGKSRQDVEKLAGMVDAVDKDIVKANALNAPTLKNDVATLVKTKAIIELKIKRVREDLKGMNDAVTAAQTELAKPVPDAKGLGVVVGKLKSFSENDTVVQLKDNLSVLVSAASALHKALAKAA